MQIKALKYVLLQVHVCQIWVFVLQDVFFFFFYFSLLTSVLFTVFTVLYDLMEESTVKNFTKCCIMTSLNCQCSMKRTLMSRYDHFNMSFNLPSSSAKQPIKKQTLRSSDKCGHKAENMLMSQRQTLLTGQLFQLLTTPLLCSLHDGWINQIKFVHEWQNTRTRLSLLFHPLFLDFGNFSPN